MRIVRQTYSTATIEGLIGPIVWVHLKKNEEVELNLNVEIKNNLIRIELVDNLFEFPLFFKEWAISMDTGKTVVGKTHQYRPKSKKELMEMLKDNIYNVYEKNRKFFYRKVTDPITSLSLLEILLDTEFFSKSRKFEKNPNDVSNFFNCSIKKFSFPIHEVSLYISKKQLKEFENMFNDMFKNTNKCLLKGWHCKLELSDFRNLGKIKVNFVNIFNNKDYFQINKNGNIYECIPTEKFKQLSKIFLECINKEMNYLKENYI